MGRKGRRAAAGKRQQSSSRKGSSQVWHHQEERAAVAEQHQTTIDSQGRGLARSGTTKKKGQQLQSSTKPPATAKGGYLKAYNKEEKLITEKILKRNKF